MPSSYDPVGDVIDTAIYVPHVTDPIRGVTTAEKMSRSDNAASRWFAGNPKVERMEYVLMDARYEYIRRKK